MKFLSDSGAEAPKSTELISQGDWHGLVKVKEFKPEVREFQWRQATGELIPPSRMRTRHLFNTLKMIWNHTMPLKFEPYKRYRFGPTHTAEYMQQAFQAIEAELFQRPDREPWMNEILQKMEEYTQGSQKILTFGNGDSLPSMQ